MSKIYRIGQIVPSSNTTMETEIPALLRAREAVEAERFTFHSSRMRMKKVVKEELEAYGVEPTWFGLGDRDVATHLVRTEMLEAGYPLSAVTAGRTVSGPAASRPWLR